MGGDIVTSNGSSRHRSVGTTLLTCMNRVQRECFGPSVQELEREGRDAQTRGFGVVGHGVGVVDEVDGEVGVVVQGAANWASTSLHRDDVEVIGRSRGRGTPGW